MKRNSKVSNLKNEIIPRRNISSNIIYNVVCIYLVGGFNLVEKILVKLDHFPKGRGENEKNI